MWAPHPDNTSPGAWVDMIEGLRLASRIARRHGVRLAIEPERANVVCDAASAETALKELGEDGRTLSIILDAANLYTPPMDPRVHPDVIDDALARLGPYLSLAHAKDIADPDAPERAADAHASNGHYRHVAAGTGILPYAHYLAGLVQATSAGGATGWRLPLILHGLDEEQVPTAVAFLRESLAGLSPA